MYILEIFSLERLLSWINKWTEPKEVGLETKETMGISGPPMNRLDSRLYNGFMEAHARDPCRRYIVNG